MITPRGREPDRRRAEVLPYNDRYLYRIAGAPEDQGGFLGIITVTSYSHRRRPCGSTPRTPTCACRGSRSTRCRRSSDTGRRRNASGAVVDDVVNKDLANASGGTPVQPATVVTTGPGRLKESNGVSHVIHVAAVEGRPGQGYQQVSEIGLCVGNSLDAADRLAADSSVRSILFPLLGAGVAGGDTHTTVRTMVDACVAHLLRRRTDGVRYIYLLATTAAELTACRATMDRERSLDRVPDDELR